MSLAAMALKGHFKGSRGAKHRENDSFAQHHVDMEA